MNRLTKATLGIALTAAIVFAALFSRADDGGKPHPMENRFLFIIDTSSAMRSRTNGIEQAVVGLLQSDMLGEFRKGDTLGFWTYSDQLHADFPMQVWSREHRQTIVSDVERYLRHQRYEKRAHIDKVFPAIGQVMEKSERLTVIFIYDGTELIHGTPFDDDINDLQKQYARRFRAAHLPMVTVLAARNSQVFDYTINYPASVTIPHTAFPEPPPQTNAPPTNAIAAVPAPVVPKPPSRRIEIIMSGTNNSSRTIPQTEAPGASAPVAPGNIVMVATPRPPAATAVAPPVAPAVVVTNMATPPVTASVVVSNMVTPTPEPTPALPPPPKPVVVAATPEPAPAPSPPPPKTVVTSAPLALSEVVPATSVPPTEPVARDARQSDRDGRAPQVLPPPPVAVATPGEQIALFVIAISLLTIAVVLVIFLVRRARGGSQASLISQSIDRGR